jgi:hypothetical protein
MEMKAKIVFKYQRKSQAEIASKSLQPDNINFINSYVEDNKLICKLKGDSITTILSTADDLLFSEMVVEKIAEFIVGDLS